MLGNFRGENLVREKLPKTVYCNAYLCPYRYLVGVCCVLNVKYVVSDHVLLHSYSTTDSNTSMGVIWVTLNMPSTAEECREPSGKCQGIVWEFHIVWRVVPLLSRIYENSQICRASEFFVTRSRSMVRAQFPLEIGSLLYFWHIIIYTKCVWRS